MTRCMLTAGKLFDKAYVLGKKRGALPLTLVSTAQRFTALAQALKRVRPVGCKPTSQPLRQSWVGLSSIFHTYHRLDFSERLHYK
jgi:hypothetical protein